jgi:hypothetical protein
MRFVRWPRSTAGSSPRWINSCTWRLVSRRALATSEVVNNFSNIFMSLFGTYYSIRHYKRHKQVAAKRYTLRVTCYNVVTSYTT